MKLKSIGVIGGGFVGGAVGRYFEKNGYQVKTYDKFKEIDPLEKVLSQDFIFIAVPTPYKDGIDLSAMDDAMANAGTCPEGKIVIIKSTIIPGTTEKYQKQYPHLNLVFNPEFLTEKTGDQDFSYPDRQIVGYTSKSYGVAGDVLGLLPLAPFSRLMPATEAELVKYFGNNWFAVKVAYANHMYDVAQKVGADYDRVKEGVAADKRIGPSHLEIFHAGYRGYGGKCLPKDIRAMIDFADKMGLDLKVLKATEEFNNQLTGGVDKQ